MGITVYAILGAVAMAIGLFFSISHNFKLSEKLETATEEATSAKAETKAVIESGKQHAEELAKARKDAKRATTAVAAIPDDACLDRPLSASAISALGVQPKDGKAKPARSGGRKRNP